MNKVGSTWFTEETAKFLVSVLVIVILILLGIKIANLFSEGKESEQAEFVLEEINRFSSSLSNGESVSILIESPKGWRIMSIDNSVCVCPSYSFGYFQTDADVLEQVSKCKKANICVSKKIYLPNNCEFNHLQNCLEISSVPFIISVTKNSAGIVLSSQGSSESSSLFYSYLSSDSPEIKAYLLDPSKESTRRALREGFNKFISEKYPARINETWKIWTSSEEAFRSYAVYDIEDSEINSRIFTSSEPEFFKSVYLDNRRYSLGFSFGYFI